MTRVIDGAVTTALGGKTVRFVTLVHLALTSGDMRLNNSSVNIPWDGHTWTGTGLLGSISVQKESVTNEIAGVTMELSGISSAAVAIALNENVQGRLATIYLAVLDEDYEVIDATIEWRGLIDRMPITDGGEHCKIVLSIESRAADYKRPFIRRYNHEDQRKDSATDRFFEYVESMVEANVIWPNKEFFRR